jgi:hypothetical protein
MTICDICGSAESVNLWTFTPSKSADLCAKCIIETIMPVHEAMADLIEDSRDKAPLQLIGFRIEGVAIDTASRATSEEETPL